MKLDMSNVPADDLTFCLIHATGRLILGMITTERLTTRIHGIDVYYPRLLQLVPMQSGNGVNLMLSPIHPIKSLQKHMIIDSSIIETFGGVEFSDDDISITASSDMIGLFRSYIESLIQWGAELSGIIAPTAHDNLMLLKPKK